MLIRELLTETYNCIKIGGIIRNLTNDEARIYKQAKKNGKLFKKDLSEFDQQLTYYMVTKGLLLRRKSKDEETRGEIYFTTRGRICPLSKQNDNNPPPPSKETNKWISKNKQKYKDKYGDDYEKYLNNHAWKIFNGKR